MPSTAHRFVSVTDAAKYVGCCTKTIRRYVAHGLLTGYRVGPRLLRVDLNELDAMLTRVPTSSRAS